LYAHRDDPLLDVCLADAIDSVLEAEQARRDSSLAAK
jgi:hypothetical protein